MYVILFCSNTVEKILWVIFLHNSDHYIMADSKVMVHEIASTTNADDYSRHSVSSISTITPQTCVLYQDSIKIPPGLVLRYQRVYLWDYRQLPSNCKWSYPPSNIPLCVPVVKELNICTNYWKPISENQSTINTVKRYAYVEPDPTLIVKLWTN